ncbi:MAG TPA: hypothetical protein VFG14_19420, partial [Chthoniobacteraceae bacterium]|nr:hypothetical protein [Chthoniobacteraceae bacterium]
MNSARLNILVTGGLFLLIISYLLSGFEEPLMAMDEGMLLAYPEQIAHGRLPYRDFETYYPPGNLLALLAAYKLSDFAVITERAVGLIYQLAIVGALFVTLRRWSLPLAAGAAILATLIVKVAQLTAFAWWGGVACILWSIIALTGATSLCRIAVAGFLGGSALLFRQDLGLAVIASTLPLLLRLSGRDRIRYLGFALVALLPLLLITVMVGVRSIFDNLFVFPVLICNPARRLPFSESSFGGLVIFGMHVLAVLVNVMASSMLVRERRDSVDARLLLGVSLIGLAITPQALQRFDILHLAFAAICSIPILPFTASWLLGRLADWHPSPKREVAVLAVTLGSLGAVAVLDPTLGRNYSISSDLYSAPLVVRDREIPIGDPILYKQLTRIAGILEKYSRPGQRIFVGPGDLRRTAFC